MSETDYISRDAALACIEGYQEKDGSIVSPEELPEYQRIEAIPAADVRENRRGKWIKIGHFGRSYKCDQCGNYLDFRGVNAGRGDANFCPNCGADMRPRTEEDDEQKN